MSQKILKNILTTLQEAIVKSGKTVWLLFKVMFPIAVIIRIFQLLGWMPYVGDILAPLMQLMGLPGEMGIVWATSILVNIYGGIFAYVTLLPDLAQPMTIAQITVLSTIILLAHTFPAELTVANRCGVRWWFAFAIRFFPALLSGILLNAIYRWGNFLTEPAEVIINLQMQNSTWGLWMFSQLKSFALIFLIIFLMVILLKILDRLKILDFINRLLHPLVKFLGISPNAIPSVVVGLTMGLAYGGGLIIAEAEERQLTPHDLLYSIVLLSLCHSIIEDTLLMFSCGAHYSGIVIFRILFALVLCRIFILLTQKTGIKPLVVSKKEKNLSQK